MKNRLILLIVMSSLAVGLAFVPQHAVQAKTCYDSNKIKIPCPKSGYLLTQEAKKNISPGNTPVPATDTSTSSPTDTPSSLPTDTPTSTPTFTPTPTDTSIPMATQPASLLIVPVKGVPQPNGCDPRIWPGTMGLGALLVVSGILAQAIRAQAVRAADAVNAYSAESHANESTLEVHTGHVDFSGPSDLAVPVALAAGGFVFVLGSVAGLFNIIPCSAWQGTLAAGVVVGGLTFLTRRWLMIVKAGSDQGEGYKYPELHSHGHDKLEEQIEVRPEKHTEQ